MSRNHADRASMLLRFFIMGVELIVIPALHSQQLFRLD